MKGPDTGTSLTYIPAAAPVAGSTESEMDPDVARVLALLDKLGQSPAMVPPTYQAPSLSHRLLGGLGDAISAMAAVRAHGQPPAIGPYAARTEQAQQEYQKRLDQFNQDQQQIQQAQRMLKAQAVVGALSEAQKQKGAMAIAKIKAQPRALKTETHTIDGRVIRDTFDASTGEHMGRQDLGAAPEPKPGFTLGYDANGNAMWFPKPTATGGASGPPVTPGGDPPAGAASRAIPVTGPGGEQVKKTPAANLQGIQQQLDNSEYLLNQMRDNWLQRPAGGARQAIGTASANYLGSGVGAKLGLSGIAAEVDKHALIHERDRKAISVALTFPFTGSRRALQSASDALEGIIPHYTDPPDVWNAFDEQVRQVIATARKMPWGDNPEQNSNLYAPVFNSFVANVASGKAAAPQSAVDSILNEYDQKKSNAKRP